MSDLNPKFEKYITGFKQGFGSTKLVIRDYLEGGWIEHMNCENPEAQGFFDGQNYKKSKGE